MISGGPTVGHSSSAGLGTPRPGRTRIRAAAPLLCALLGAAFPAAAAVQQLPVNLAGAGDNQVCFGCHGEDARTARPAPGRSRPGYVDPKAYAASVHGHRACTDCHDDITSIPHGGVGKVRCGRCHPMGGGHVASKPKSKTDEGAHAAALRAGKENAADCAGCHGTHNITGPADKSSRVNRANVPATCGRCHLDEYAAYRRSVHGEAVARGETDAAVCIDCHGEHSGLRAKSDPSSTVHPLHVPDTCGRCHESAQLADRHGLPPARYSTYRESYHGIAAKFGDVRAANCASCHGFHDILPSANPESRVHHTRLAQTCGECHPGATSNFARGSVHLMPTPKHDAPVYWAGIFYRIFVTLIMAQFLGLIALDLLARRREARRGDEHA